MQLPGPVQVPGQQGEPSEAGQPVGRVGPQSQVLGDAQTLVVQAGGPLIVAGDLGEIAEHVGRLQLPPAVAEFTEDRQTLGA